MQTGNRNTNSMECFVSFKSLHHFTKKKTPHNCTEASKVYFFNLVCVKKSPNISSTGNTVDTFLYFRDRSYGISSRAVYHLQSTLVCSCSIIWNCSFSHSRNVFLRGKIFIFFTRGTAGYSATITFNIHTRVSK